MKTEHFSARVHLGAGEQMRQQLRPGESMAELFDRAIAGLERGTERLAGHVTEAWEEAISGILARLRALEDKAVTQPVAQPVTQPVSQHVTQPVTHQGKPSLIEIRRRAVETWDAAPDGQRSHQVLDYLKSVGQPKPSNLSRAITQWRQA